MVEFNKKDFLNGNDINLGDNIRIKINPLIHIEYGKAIMSCINGERSFGRIYENKNNVNNPIKVVSSDNRVFWTDGNRKTSDIKRLQNFVSKHKSKSIIFCNFKIYKKPDNNYPDIHDTFGDVIPIHEIEKLLEDNKILSFNKDVLSLQEAKDIFIKKSIKELLNKDIPDVLKEEKNKLLEKIKKIDSVYENIINISNNLKEKPKTLDFSPEM